MFSLPMPSTLSARRRGLEEEQEGMEDWDQEQLEKVIADKHAKEKANATSIICKHFLDAVERKQYGWCGFLFIHLVVDLFFRLVDWR